MPIDMTTELGLKSQLPEQLRPIIMSLTRGRKSLSHLTIRLLALPEDADRSQFTDPFTAQDIKTGKPIKLRGKERVEAYVRMGIQPPQRLVEAVNLHLKIKKGKDEQIARRVGR